MDPQSETFGPDLSSYSRGEWLGALRKIGEEYGFAEPMGKSHAAVFVEEGDTLLVAFETMSGIETLSETRTPIGFDMVAANGWSSLSMLSHGDTWFRDPKVYEFFDQMLDDGFFDEFENVIFYGAGSCGYAAGAYSVTSPGARVLMLQPQATLDPRVAEWDDRFTEERRRDFTSRYGFAPEMLEAAERACLIYDPRERLDAMHSALFARPNVTRFRAPFMGGALQAEFRALDLLPGLLTAAAENRLDTALFAAMLRARRDHPPYLRRLLARVDTPNHRDLTRMLCQNVVARMQAPRFRRRLTQLEAGDDEA
ncbi:phosphoadenosine phosphosulfate reductase [Maliponia aquimaris]|uniref:Phosphoadenosine phosphosulfate reductase n=1 Tax=Maliponia aquimaris TaxID=1673631 RepID=A0A238JZN5_9RHOB|nr:phosphoadenosine phosphosulfate reductase [Maliponia aquimaris]SMX36095.1 hypothetical protein MAA8898_00750 [Maliponia aquimaris]